MLASQGPKSPASWVFVFQETFITSNDSRFLDNPISSSHSRLGLSGKQCYSPERNSYWWLREEVRRRDGMLASVGPRYEDIFHGRHSQLVCRPDQPSLPHTKTSQPS